MTANPIRVRVLSNDTDEPELIGMEGDLLKIEKGRMLVFLDGDSMPTWFPNYEIEVI